jgi:uncharacterized protein HemY
MSEAELKASLFEKWMDTRPVCFLLSTHSAYLANDRRAGQDHLNEILKGEENKNSKMKI